MIVGTPNCMGAKHIEPGKVRGFLEWVEVEHGPRTRQECERLLSTSKDKVDLFALLQAARTAIHAKADIRAFQHQPMEFNT